MSQCLNDHNLTNYEGIINVRDRYVETTNLYSLRGVGLEEDLLIIAEDKHALAHEVPVPCNGQQMTLLVPKNETHPASTQLIEMLKGIQCSPPVDSSEKENADPNIPHNQSSGRGSEPRSSPSKRDPALRPALKMAGSFTVRPFDFSCQQLLKKAQCLKSRKERRQCSRAVQERASSCERVHSAKKIKQRSLSR